MALGNENEEMKDANMITYELMQIKNLVEKQQNHDTTDDRAIKYLSEKIMKISDINLNLKNEIEKVELAISSYEVKAFNNLNINESTNVMLYILMFFFKLI